MRLPLTVSQLEEAGQVAARLAADLGKLIASLPPESRGASAMARVTGSPRVTCQRVVGAVADPHPAPQMLARLPGIEGLSQFIDGFERSEASREDVALARAAVEAFRRLIESAGGSHARLVERLTAPVARGASEGRVGTIEQREALFRAAAAATGRRCRVSFSSYAFRPRPGSTDVLERVLVKGLMGGEGTPGGMPFVLASGQTVEPSSTGAAGPITLGRGAPIAENAPEAILAAFSSDPLPTVAARGRAGNLYQVIDVPAHAVVPPVPGLVDGEAGSDGTSPRALAPFDVVTALRASSPMIDPTTGRPSLTSVWSLASCPAEALILDVWLHESIERDFRPGLECLLWQAELDIPPERRWMSRVPGAPRLQLLGHGLRLARSDLHARHAEVTAAMFEQAGMEAERFIGFRCEVRYPVWRAGYCMTFDPPEPPGESA
ncbi:MAG: hypothetical protein AB7K52_04260 [Phycisphaerales bacterium]